MADSAVPGSKPASTFHRLFADGRAARRRRGGRPGAVLSDATGVAPALALLLEQSKLLAPADAVQDRLTCALPAVAVNPAGAAGMVTVATGVADACVELPLAPAELTARTTK